jgi:hypothetical protein
MTSRCGGALSIMMRPLGAAPRGPWLRTHQGGASDSFAVATLARCASSIRVADVTHRRRAPSLRQPSSGTMSGTAATVVSLYRFEKRSRIMRGSSVAWLGLWSDPQFGLAVDNATRVPTAPLDTPATSRHAVPCSATAGIPRAPCQR